MNLKAGDICKVDFRKLRGELSGNQLNFLRKVYQAGGGKVVIDKLNSPPRGMSMGSAMVSSYGIPVSKTLGSVSVPWDILIPTGKTASTRDETMNLAFEFRRLAQEILADNKDYKYDPDHKNRPSGGGWKETDSGWSRGTGENEHKKEMSTTQKIPKIEIEAPSKPQENEKPMAPVVKAPDGKGKETLWPQALPSEIPAPSPYSEFVKKPEIKAMKKDISINPNTVISNLFQNKDYVPEQHKANLVKLYKSWLSENGNVEDEDGKGKIETVKTVLKMLQPPKFKKTQPRITGGMEGLIRDNNLGDELSEMAGFKEAIRNHPQMSDKEYKDRIEKKIRLPRNQQQLKNAFIQNMNPQNYPSIDAFNASKKRVQSMSTADFGKLLASLNSDEEEIS